MPGFRHIAYRVDDVDAMVRKTRDAECGTKGEIVDPDEIYRLVYVDCYEGLIAEFVEQRSS